MRSGHLRSALVAAGVCLASLVVEPAAAQVPGDSTAVADTAAVADSTAVADSLAQEAQDSVSADTIYYNLPSLQSGVPSGFATGIWEWDREGILTSTANTLAELLAEVPGVIELLGGDYGTPAALSAFGSGSGGVRVFRDGFEITPLAGGVADLQRIGLGGVVHVRLERRGGEMIIELTSYRYEDGRPFTLIEAGTGQLDTNLFRGTFADPTALGGSLALALERVDTRGYGENEGGNRTGYWFRYQLHRQNRAGISLEARRLTSKTEVSDYATSVRRTDLTVRGRLEIVNGVVAEAYTGRSTHDVKDSREAYGYEGGTRVQHGVRLAARRGALWARAAYRLGPDDDLPSHRLEGSAGVTAARFGAYGNASRSSWAGTSVLGYGVGGWLGPVEGVTLFGSFDGGEYAGRAGPVSDELPDPVIPQPLPTHPDDPAPYILERSLLRGGASATLWGVTLAGAGLRAETDKQVPLELELDRGAPSVTGGVRYGFEGFASLPLPILEGLRLEGSYQQWDAEGVYLPRRIYRGSFEFHRVYLESGNFELWWSLGVRGHDPSLVLVPSGGVNGLETVPFFQDWYGRITARILSVRLFFTWDNLAVRRNLQNFPGRLLPPTRSFFGLRWDLWN
ncbi:MAG: hypothetical protein PVF69_06815 [Gemmatimonadota bacterium]